ncbi:O-methyltransferase MdmC-like [Gigantopelta aegis]|uniref:O-methyltransferase MdmC-like n=1 Tax=Gigantopelta aegis TaxID=1735272 RepID=UPI001B888F89|nr:O-methyltransferase MdmC-like [Gigantopelta aegis]
MSEITFPPEEPKNNNFQPYYRRLVALKNHGNYKDWPQEVKYGIDHVIKLIDARENYVENVCSKPGKVLAEISEFTETTDWAELHKSGKTTCPLPSDMLTGHVEGLFLKFLVSMQQAKYVLDIGMFTGYSALSMAEALPADGKVFTCDREQYLADLNRKVFDSSPHGKKIEIRLGDVGDTLKALAKDGVQIDFVFLDAGAEKYGEYFDFLLDKNILAPRGTIAVDNTLWFGRSYLEHENHRAKFNKKITEDRRVQQVLLPVRDGIIADSEELVI